MAQQTNITAVQWLYNKMYEHRGNITIEEYEQAKQMEKDKERQKLIGLLDWMNKVAADNPMAFETDHDDIVDMYLNGYYGYLSDIYTL